MPGIPKQPRFRLDSESYRRLCQQVWKETSGPASIVAAEANFRSITYNQGPGEGMIPRKT